MTTSLQDQSLIDLLEQYRINLINNTLSWKQRLLLVELNIKDSLLQDNRSLLIDDEECLKYMFLGAFIYNHILPQDSVSLIL